MFFAPTGCYRSIVNSDWQPCVYIRARASHSTFYTGVTTRLIARIQQHRDEVVPSFTRRYGIKLLVFMAVPVEGVSSILREKRIKRWPRAWKYDLIHKDNPTWRDLAEDFGFDPLPLGRRIPAQGRDDN